MGRSFLLLVPDKRKNVVMDQHLRLHGQINPIHQTVGSRLLSAMIVECKRFIYLFALFSHLFIPALFFCFNLFPLAVVVVKEAAFVCMFNNQGLATVDSIFPQCHWYSWCISSVVMVCLLLMLFRNIEMNSGPNPQGKHFCTYAHLHSLNNYYIYT